MRYKLAALLLLFCTGPAAAAGPLVFGFSPGANSLVSTEAEARLVTDYLAQKLGRKVEVFALEGSGRLLSAVNAGEVDFAVLDSTAIHSASDGLLVIANFSRSESPSHEILLLTAKSSGLDSVEKLIKAEPTLVLDEDSPARLSFLMGVLQRSPDKVFRHRSVAPQPFQALPSLINGAYDAACVESGLLEAVKRFNIGMVRQIQVIASQGPYASDPLVARPDYPPAVIGRIRNALVGMADDPIGQQVLLGLKLTRFVEPQRDIAYYPRPPRLVSEELAPEQEEVPEVAPTEPVAVVAPPAVPAPALKPEVVIREELETQMEAEREERRRKAYDEARKIDSAEGYRVYLTLYPDAPEASEIRLRLQAIQSDDEAYNAARDSEEGLKAYVAFRSDGRHVKAARQRLEELRRMRLETDYQSAMAEDTVRSLEGFLVRWPAAPQAEKVRTSLDEKRRAAQQAVAASEPVPAPKPEPRVWELVAPAVSEIPAVDGRSDDKAWRAARPLEVPARGRDGATDLRLRALHDGARLYLLAEWEDATHDQEYRPWLWSEEGKSYDQGEQLDDGLAVAWYRGTPPKDSCMLHGEEQESDLWTWRAFWSGLTGLASDGVLRVSKERMSKSTPYVARDGGQIWIRQSADAGTPGYRFHVPLEYGGDRLPSYRAQEATGSQADIRCGGEWNKGIWAVEFSRELDTGEPDDVVLVEGEVQYVSFAIFDHAQGDRHAASPVVRVVLRGR